jgi:hypothetical protein
MQRPHPLQNEARIKGFGLSFIISSGARKKLLIGTTAIERASDVPLDTREEILKFKLTMSEPCHFVSHLRNHMSYKPWLCLCIQGDLWNLL